MEKIIFTGGGTMGSVTPLLAVAEKLKDTNPNIDLYWIGTQEGPESKVIRQYNIEFKAIYSGKLRRYFSLFNFIDLFKILIGFFQALIILIKLRPRAIVSAGGYVAVPVVWAGWLIGVPSLIHQQDVRVGLANKLCARAAKKITVCFAETALYFNQKKTQVIGNPVRQSLKQEYKKEKNKLPVVLVMGGGKGAKSINSFVWNSIKELVKFCQVVHITGVKFPISNFQFPNSDRYHEHEFIADNADILSKADLIISRAGMGTLTEIAYLSKPSIIIPIPDSHQVENARYFSDRQAVIILDQEELDEDEFVKSIRELLKDKKKMKELGKNAQQVIKWGAENEMAGLIIGLIK